MNFLVIYVCDFFKQDESNLFYKNNSPSVFLIFFYLKFVNWYIVYSFYDYFGKLCFNIWVKYWLTYWPIDLLIDWLELKHSVRIVPNRGLMSITKQIFEKSFFKLNFARQNIKWEVVKFFEIYFEVPRIYLITYWCVCRYA